MTQQNAPIAAGDLHGALRDLDGRGERPTGLVMSPETWAMLAAQAEPQDRAKAVYAGLPVWVRTDCEGVELIPCAAKPAKAADEVWL